MSRPQKDIANFGFIHVVVYRWFFPLPRPRPKNMFKKTASTSHASQGIWCQYEPWVRSHTPGEQKAQLSMLHLLRYVEIVIVFRLRDCASSFRVPIKCHHSHTLVIGIWGVPRMGAPKNRQSDLPASSIGDMTRSTHLHRAGFSFNNSLSVLFHLFHCSAFIHAAVFPLAVVFGFAATVQVSSFCHRWRAMSISSRFTLSVSD